MSGGGKVRDFQDADRLFEFHRCSSIGVHFQTTEVLNTFFCVFLAINK